MDPEQTVLVRANAERNGFRGGGVLVITGQPQKVTLYAHIPWFFDTGPEEAKAVFKNIGDVVAQGHFDQDYLNRVAHQRGAFPWRPGSECLARDFYPEWTDIKSRTRRGEAQKGCGGCRKRERERKPDEGSAEAPTIRRQRKTTRRPAKRARKIVAPESGAPGSPAG